MLIGYIRASSSNENTCSEKAALQRFGCLQIVQDVAGRVQDNQAELAVVLNCMRAGDTLVVPKLARLACSLNNLIAIIRGLTSKNIEFISLQEGIDTSLHADASNIFAILSEFQQRVELERRRSRISHSAGRSPGRPRKLSDSRLASQYSNNPNYSITEICQRLGVSKGTLYQQMKLIGKPSIVRPRGRNGGRPRKFGDKVVILAQRLATDPLGSPDKAGALLGMSRSTVYRRLKLLCPGLNTDK